MSIYIMGIFMVFISTLFDKVNKAMYIRYTFLLLIVLASLFSSQVLESLNYIPALLRSDDGLNETLVLLVVYPLLRGNLRKIDFFTLCFFYIGFCCFFELFRACELFVNFEFSYISWLLFTR